MDRVAELLERMVVAAGKAPTPPGTWCLTRARSITPPDGAATTTKVDYYLSCLNAFRDDAHLSAWQAHDVSGEAWELFTSIWHDERKPLDELIGELAFRGHDRAAYMAALQELQAKGWLTVAAGGAAVPTPAGRTLREEVEERTDQYFAIAESALTPAEAEELNALLAKILDALSD
jgi:hypothetical protein